MELAGADSDDRKRRRAQKKRKKKKRCCQWAIALKEMGGGEAQAAVWQLARKCCL